MGALIETRCNCGTWVGYVKWKEMGSYYWVSPKVDLYSDGTYAGDCNGDKPIFTEKKNNVALSGWNRLSIKHTDKFTNHPKCTHIGVAMSPGYTYRELIPLFRDVVKDFEIPYMKGRAIE